MFTMVVIKNNPGSYAVADAKHKISNYLLNEIVI